MSCLSPLPPEPPVTSRPPPPPASGVLAPLPEGFASCLWGFLHGGVVKEGPIQQQDLWTTCQGRLTFLAGLL